MSPVICYEFPAGRLRIYVETASQADPLASSRRRMRENGDALVKSYSVISFRLKNASECRGWERRTDQYLRPEQRRFKDATVHVYVTFSVSTENTRSREYIVKTHRNYVHSPCVWTNLSIRAAYYVHETVPFKYLACPSGFANLIVG